MKIIDFETKGNVIRFALGADDCNDYWGDDWDDIPYEHNAGPVYNDYITGYATVFVPFDYTVCDIEHDWHYQNGNYNSGLAKEDFKLENAPCLVVDMCPDWDASYSNAALKKNSIEFFFNDTLEPGTYALDHGSLKPV